MSLIDVLLNDVIPPSSNEIFILLDNTLTTLPFKYLSLPLITSFGSPLCTTSTLLWYIHVVVRCVNVLGIARLL